jgi:hypothetical protein
MGDWTTNQSCSRSAAFLKLSQRLRGVRSAGVALSVRAGELGDKSDMGGLFRDAKALARAAGTRRLRNEAMKFGGNSSGVAGGRSCCFAAALCWHHRAKFACQRNPTESRVGKPAQWLSKPNCAAHA